MAHTTQPPLPHLLYSHDNTKTLYLWDADCESLVALCRRERRLLEGLNQHPVAHWSPDGAYVAVYLAESWALFPAACLLEQTHCPPIPLDPAANDNRVAWGPDGTTIAYMTSLSETSMRIRSKGCWDGSPVHHCFTQTIQLAANGAMRQPTWSADGGRFAFLGLQPRGLFVLDANCLASSDGCAGHLTHLPVHQWPVYWPSLSADGGELLYFAETADGVEQLYLAHLDTLQIQQVSFQAGGASVPAWSSDGRYIAFAGFHRRFSGDLGIYILDRERGLVASAIRRHGQDFAYPAWSPTP